MWSPLRFWVQLQSNEEAFKKLQIKLKCKMAISKRIMEIIEENQTVVVMYRKLWQRGLISGISKEKRIIQIHLKDIGKQIWLPSSKIYILEDEFKKLPWQAIACALAYTGSDPPASTWPNATKKFSCIIAEGCKGWIHVI